MAWNVTITIIIVHCFSRANPIFRHIFSSKFLCHISNITFSLNSVASDFCENGYSNLQTLVEVTRKLPEIQQDAGNRDL